jgi:hypothetical protein
MCGAAGAGGGTRALSYSWNSSGMGMASSRLLGWAGSNVISWLNKPHGLLVCLLHITTMFTSAQLRIYLTAADAHASECSSVLFQSLLPDGRRRRHIPAELQVSMLQKKGLLHGVLPARWKWGAGSPTRAVEAVPGVLKMGYQLVVSQEWGGLSLRPGGERCVVFVS